MSTAEKIFHKAQNLPEEAQDKLLGLAEEFAKDSIATPLNSLTLRETAELRGKLAAWEDDWNAPRHGDLRPDLNLRIIPTASPFPVRFPPRRLFFYE